MFQKNVRAGLSLYQIQSRPNTVMDCGCTVQNRVFKKVVRDLGPLVGSAIRREDHCQACGCLYPRTSAEMQVIKEAQRQFDIWAEELLTSAGMN